MVNSKFKLAIVNLWNGNIHGEVPIIQNYPSSEVLSNHFINECSISIEEFYDKDNYRYINKFIKEINNNIYERIENNEFGNYYTPIFNNIINNNIISVHLIQHINIGEYHMAILKTHWIRLIQRRWREIRKKRINAKKNIFNIRHREIYGKYPDSCNIPFKLGL